MGIRKIGIDLQNFFKLKNRFIIPTRQNISVTAQGIGRIRSMGIPFFGPLQSGNGFGVSALTCQTFAIHLA